MGGMGKIPFDPKSVTAENPDVRRMLAVLESGGSYSSAVATCPVCGSEHVYDRVVCQREYCVAVWKAVKKLFRNRAKPKLQTATETLAAPQRAATREEWRERNRPIFCERMRATLSALHCGTNRRCFEPQTCARVPEGRRSHRGLYDGNLAAL